jgi:hypothetical protein
VRRIEDRVEGRGDGKTEIPVPIPVEVAGGHGAVDSGQRLERLVPRVDSRLSTLNAALVQVEVGALARAELVNGEDQVDVSIRIDVHVVQPEPHRGLAGYRSREIPDLEATRVALLLPALVEEDRLREGVEGRVPAGDIQVAVDVEVGEGHAVGAVRRGRQGAGTVRELASALVEEEEVLRRGADEDVEVAISVDVPGGRIAADRGRIDRGIREEAPGRREGSAVVPEELVRLGRRWNAVGSRDAVRDEEVEVAVSVEIRQERGVTLQAGRGRERELLALEAIAGVPVEGVARRARGGEHKRIGLSVSIHVPEGEAASLDLVGRRNLPGALLVEGAGAVARQDLDEVFSVLFRRESEKKEVQVPISVEVARLRELGGEARRNRQCHALEGHANRGLAGTDAEVEPSGPAPRRARDGIDLRP